MKNLFTTKAGSPQTRIKISNDDNAPLYYYYSADDIRDDLNGADDRPDYSEVTQIRTWDKVETVHEGDLVLSLSTGMAAIVSEDHEGYLITQNLVKLSPCEKLDKKYLLFLLNDTDLIKGQFAIGISGHKKLTVGLVAGVEIKSLPDLKTQRQIGELYIKQKHLTYLRSQSLELKEQYVLESLRRKATQ